MSAERLDVIRFVHEKHCDWCEWDAPCPVADLLAEVDWLRNERDSFARMHVEAVVAVSDAIDAIEPDADVEGTVPSIWWLRRKVEQLQAREAQR
jgi:hypothetical protein